MSDALIYLGTCILGYFLAIPLRRHKEKLGFISTLQLISLLCLVLAMGVRIGANRNVVSNLGSYGIYALVFTAASMAASVFCIFIVRQLMGIDRYGMMKERAVSAEEKRVTERSVSETAELAQSGGIDRLTIFIVVCVAAGIAAGYYASGHWITDAESFSSRISFVISAGLMLLLLFIGMDLGLDGTVFANFKKVGLRVLVFPAATAVGTLASCAVCALFLPVTVKEGLAIGSGFAWYSLAPGIILDAGHIMAGTISFMHNVMREVFSIILIPIVARKIGYVECTGLCGSTGMDVCLPVVERATSGNIAVYSFVSGFVLSMSVPLLVPLFV